MAISRSQITVAVNNDKTGYTLTAGSYTIRASSTQRGTITVSGGTSNTGTISSVTTTRAQHTQAGCSVGSVDSDHLARSILTNATTVTATTGVTASTTNVTFEVAEFI